MQFIDLKKQQSLIRENLEKRLRIIFDHGKYIMGPEVLELEKILADYVSAKYCITCSSGTDALLIPLLSKNIGPGDAVLTSPFSYIATAEVIALVGATPIFVDIYESTYNIDPQKIDKAINFAISRDLNPKAIIPVDLFGLPARHRRSPSRKMASPTRRQKFACVGGKDTHGTQGHKFAARCRRFGGGVKRANRPCL